MTATNCARQQPPPELDYWKDHSSSVSWTRTITTTKPTMQPYSWPPPPNNDDEENQERRPSRRQRGQEPPRMEQEYRSGQENDEDPSPHDLDSSQPRPPVRPENEDENQERVWSDDTERRAARSSRRHKKARHSWNDPWDEIMPGSFQNHGPPEPQEQQRQQQQQHAEPSLAPAPIAVAAAPASEETLPRMDSRNAAASTLSVPYDYLEDQHDPLLTFPPPRSARSGHHQDPTRNETRPSLLPSSGSQQQAQPQEQPQHVLTGRPPITLYLSPDHTSFSSLQVLIRQNVEFFEAQPHHVVLQQQQQEQLQDQRNRLLTCGNSHATVTRTIRVGQVGVRCCFCARHHHSLSSSVVSGAASSSSFRASSVSTTTGSSWSSSLVVVPEAVQYPDRLDQVYEAVQTIARVHWNAKRTVASCPCLPQRFRAEFRARQAHEHEAPPPQQQQDEPQHQGADQQHHHQERQQRQFQWTQSLWAQRTKALGIFEDADGGLRFAPTINAFGFPTDPIY